MDDEDIGKSLAAISKAYYGYKADNNVFAGGNPGTALMGKYVAESNQKLASAIVTLADATRQLANRPIVVNVSTPTYTAPPKTKGSTKPNPQEDK